MRVQANDKDELIKKIYNEKGIIKVADVLDKARSSNGLAELGSSEFNRNRVRCDSRRTNGDCYGRDGSGCC